MSSNQPTVEELNYIKTSLEQKMEESSDSEYTPSTSSGSSCSRKSRRNSTNYKTKYNSLESKIRYMQLEMVNKEIEITELNTKILVLTKYDDLFKKINFLFERLDNALKVLTERVNTIDDKHYIKYITINTLDTIKVSCDKVLEKYSVYLANEINPLFSDNQLYLKNSINGLYELKQKEYASFVTLINDKLHVIKIYNTLYMSLFVFLFLIVINILLMCCYLLFSYGYIRK